MEIGRRQFLNHLGLAAAGVSLGSGLTGRDNEQGNHRKGSRMKLTFSPYSLELKHQFTLSGSSRSTTPVMLTCIEYEGITGYGEASMPPYLGETQESAGAFLARVDLGQFRDPLLLEDILDYIDNLDSENKAVKASVDIALHDLAGKMMNQPWYRIWGLDREKAPETSFTIGIDSAEIVREKTREASDYKILKVKLGRDNDKEMIRAVRSVTDVPIGVDINQGWTDRVKALDLIFWLKEQGVVLIEQPMAKEKTDDLAWLTERSPLPVYGDEAVQRLPDVLKAQGIYHGINIKLMKCTGMHEAYLMAQLAKKLGLKVMIGCMTETSCAISAAAHLSPMAEFADLDGNLLIKNDPFTGMKIESGKIKLEDFPGIGVFEKS